MTTAKEVIRLLILLDRCRSTIIYLEACLKHPETVKYQYPEQTEALVNSIVSEIESPLTCKHSSYVRDCPSCNRILSRGTL